MKAIYYICHLFKSSFSNRARVMLTSIGVFLSVFLFSTGMFITDSYYAAFFKILNDMDERSLIISTQYDETTLKKKLSFSSSLNLSKNMLLFQPIIVSKTRLSDGSIFNLCINLIGISGNSDVIPTKINDNEIIAIQPTLLKGRLINENDLYNKKNVLVINE